MPHRLVMTRQVRDWLHALRSGDPVTRRLVAEAIDRLLDDGPALGRPLADRIAGAGDKSGRWQEWYAQAIPAAEATYEAYLKEQR